MFIADVYKTIQSFCPEKGVYGQITDFGHVALVKADTLLDLRYKINSIVKLGQDNVSYGDDNILYIDQLENDDGCVMSESERIAWNSHDQKGWLADYTIEITETVPVLASKLFED